MRAPTRPVLLLGAATCALLVPTSAGATTAAIQADPPPIVQTTVPANPMFGGDPRGGTIPLIYSFGIGESAPGQAFATVTVVVDRPGCELQVSLGESGSERGPGAEETQRSGTVVAGAPLTLRTGAATSDVYGLSVSEGVAKQPGCPGAPVGIAFGTQPGDRIIPVAQARAESDARAAAAAAAAAPLVRRVSYASAGRRTTVRLARVLGASETRTYRVRLTRSGRTWATGTLRGTTLRLTTAKGRSRPLGAFALRSAAGQRRGGALATTPITIAR